MSGMLQRFAFKPGWLGLIVLAGFTLRLSFIVLIPAVPLSTSDFGNYHLLAQNLVASGIYGYGTMPSSHVAPGTSIFLALVYKLAGSTDILYPKIVQVAIGTLDILLVYYIAMKAFNCKTALVAAALWALFPAAIAYTSLLASENIFTFLILLSLALLVSPGKEPGRLNIGSFIAGALLGVSMLVRPVVMLLPAVYILYVFFNKRDKPARVAALACVLLLLGVFISIAPWCLRNYAEFGHFDIASNGGVNFWMGNNADATGRYMNMERLINETYGNVSGLSDFEQDALFSAAGKAYVLAHPAETLARDMNKIGVLYGSSTSGAYWSMIGPGVIRDPVLSAYLSLNGPTIYRIFNWYYYAMLIMAMIGAAFVILYRKELYRPAIILLALYILYFTAVYAATVAEDRYVFSVMPVLAIFGACGIVKAISFARGRRKLKS